MSNEFEILYNSIMSNQAPGLDEYEKSVFLTLGQRDLILSYFNPKSNKLQEGLDDSKERQINFLNLIKVAEIEYVHNPSTFDPRSITVPLPKDLLLILNEYCIESSIRYTVQPISYSEYDKISSRPFPYPPKNIVWRLMTQSTTQSNFAELIGNPTFESDDFRYYLRYVMIPDPIILEPLNGRTIEGKSEEMECKLDSSTHHEIVQRAVELAKAAYIGDLNTQIAVGQISQTDIGLVQQSR